MGRDGLAEVGRERDGRDADEGRDNTSTCSTAAGGCSGE